MGVIIGIFSAKGGVGKTILASNLAATFAFDHHIPTALIDLNPGTGMADLLLDLDPKRSWWDLRDVFKELTAKQLELAVTEYRPGLDLLASPPNILWEKPLSKTDLISLLEVCRRVYDLVLIDVEGGVSDLALSAFEIVDVCLILLTPDAPALRTTSRYAKKPIGFSPSHAGDDR